MILPGHLAAAYLLLQATHCEHRGVWWGAMFPDLVDKPLRWVLKMTPNDRVPAHSGLGWGVCTLAAWAWRGRAFAGSFAAGYGIHMLCDALNARMNRGRVYWLWPFRHYDMHIGPTGLVSSLRDFKWRSLVIEAALTGLGITYAVAQQTRNTSKPAVRSVA